MNLKDNQFYPINQPYGWCILPISPGYRDQTSSETFGNGINYPECIPKIVQPPSVIGPQNTASVNKLDQYFFNQQTHLPSGINSKSYNSVLQSLYDTPGNPNLQTPRPNETKVNSYISLASQSLHISPDTIMNIFFSDDNINHLRNTIVSKVKQVTANSGIAGNKEGVLIKQPNMDDMFYYMVNIYQNYKIHNGSICFLNVKKQTDIKAELIKLNTNLLQEYVSKMVSQINMYIYYYKDASQLPEQLALPLLTSMKGSKSLEYNTGFTPGNSIGIASYNEVGNF
jgi:hypothetical protein